MYQRLFEWRRESIMGLMQDLFNNYKEKGENSPYYVGMLTSTSQHELVDGQQRFSVLMLLGIVFRDLCTDPSVQDGWEVPYDR